MIVFSFLGNNLLVNKSSLSFLQVKSIFCINYFEDNWFFWYLLVHFFKERCFFLFSFEVSKILNEFLGLLIHFTSLYFLLQFCKQSQITKTQLRKEKIIPLIKFKNVKKYGNISLAPFFLFD